MYLSEGLYLLKHLAEAHGWQVPTIDMEYQILVENIGTALQN